MRDTFKKLIELLSKKEQKSLLWLLVIMTFMGALELIGVTAIFPLISILASPQVIHTNKYLTLLYNTGDFDTDKAFILFIGFLVFSLTVLSALFNIFTNYKIYKTSELLSSSLSQRLLEVYLKKNYSFFLQRNTIELSKNVLSEVHQVNSGVILPLLQSISKAISVAAIFILLLWVDYKVAIGVVLLFGVSYIGIFLLIKKKVAFAGEQRLDSNKKKYNVVSQAFGGVKDILLTNSQSVFLKDFAKYFNQHAKYQLQHQIYGFTPRYILEIIAFGSMIIFLLWMYVQYGDFKEMLPLLSLFALSGYKTMPALQLIYNSLTKIRFYSASVDVLHKDMFSTENEQKISYSNGETIDFKKEIKFHQISFSYEKSPKVVLDQMNFSIEAFSTVGIVGSTGAGKTTVVDLLMGLLHPTGGKILIDEKVLSGQNVISWQTKIGYVPQRIYLSDESVTKNIAFGIAENEIDIERVVEVAKMARLHDFVSKELPKGYDTIVGERGIRLSGGQCQRIGIARALYRKPAILVLDEATSALDNITESEVLDTIKSLSGKCTILMIAHRLSTITNCDKILFLGNGQVIAEGKYSELLVKSQAFRELANKTTPIPLS